MLKMYSSLHPGKTIKELWLGPMGVSRKTLFKIANGSGRVTPEIALRLSVGLAVARKAGWAIKRPPIEGPISHQKGGNS